MDLSNFYPNGDPFSRFADPGGPPAPSLEAQEAEQRRLESEAIAKRYAEELSKRGARSAFSPEYLATLPRSMAEKLRVTPEEEEEVLYHFAATASIPRTAAASGVSAEKVRAIVYNPQSQGAIAEYRNAMRVSVIERMKETQYVLLDAIQAPRAIEQASITQLATVLETVSTVQLNLQEAEFSASRASAGLSDPSAIFSGDELEYMALLRRRLESGGSPQALPHEIQDPSHHAMNGHEFVDTSGEILEVETTSNEIEGDDPLPLSPTPADPGKEQPGSVGEEAAPGFFLDEKMTMEEKARLTDAVHRIMAEE